MNKIEMLLITFGLKRLKSQSPKEYKLITSVSLLLATLCGLLVIGQPELVALLPAQAALITAGAHWATIIGGALTSAGLVSATTTTDPKLMLDQLPNEIKSVEDAASDVSKKN